jgi:protease-4
MRKAGWLVILFVASSGCLRPIRTQISIDGPIDGHVTARLPAKDNASPLVEMPVEGQGPVRGPKIAIIDVDGLILNQNMTGPLSAGENPVDVFRERLDAAAADGSVCAVVVRINSPGGAVTASDIMWRELKNFRARTQRPVVACVMDLGCGGAYYLASAADAIVAHPTSIVGGIGVVLNLYNLQDFLGIFNIVSQSIKAGNQIDMGTVVEALGPDARKMLQRMADEFHERFQKVVQDRRPNVVLDKGTTFDGRVFTARDALERKLIDHIGYLDDALAAARALSNRPDARAVLLHRCNDLARTPYAITPNEPLHANLLPVSVPGAERSRLPTFLYLWQTDPTMQRMSGK